MIRKKTVIGLGYSAARATPTAVFLCKIQKSLYICSMALIAMAIYDTPENGREQYTERCLENIFRPRVSKNPDDRHHFVFVVNAATPATLEKLDWFYKSHRHLVTVIGMKGNVGTALAINQAWKLRQPGQNAVKMDNDVEIRCWDWIEQMEEALARAPEIGLIGLKRKDLIQHPNHPDPFYRSSLHFIPSVPVKGEPWMIVEKTADVMGTCTMFSSACLGKIGYLYQPGLYGFDDVIACERVRKAGFYCAFLHGIEIDHIDEGGGEYQTWKHRQANLDSPEFHRIREMIQAGTAPVWVDADYA